MTSLKMTSCRRRIRFRLAQGAKQRKKPADQVLFGSSSARNQHKSTPREENPDTRRQKRKSFWTMVATTSNTLLLAALTIMSLYTLSAANPTCKSLVVDPCYAAEKCEEKTDATERRRLRVRGGLRRQEVVGVEVRFRLRGRHGEAPLVVHDRLPVQVRRHRALRGPRL